MHFQHLYTTVIMVSLRHHDVTSLNPLIEKSHVRHWSYSLYISDSGWHILVSKLEQVQQPGKVEFRIASSVE